uniref:Uncharacterized protein n=1 Tax=Cacopsylla melanoneura TaxID=428564 RepID=A0A8D8RZM2_9HEMI
MEKANEKSVYELLAMTASDSSSISDVPDIVFRTEPAVPKQKRRKRRLKRHQRNNLTSNPSTCDEDDLILNGPVAGAGHHTSNKLSTLFCPYLNHSLVYCFCIAIVLSWLITLTLLLISFHADLSQLDSSVESVVAGSQGVPDALQRCHSLSKQLERNQSELVTKFNSLAVQIRNFSIQIADLHTTIAGVQAQLAASPQVLDVPARLKDLASSVATFGSSLKDLTNTVTNVKAESDQTRTETNVLAANVTRLKDSLDLAERRESQLQQLQPSSTDLNTQLQSQLSDLSSNLSHVNQTLSARLGFLTDDQTKNRKNIEELQNTYSNVSTRVSSVEADVSSLSQSMTSVTRDVTSLTTSLGQLRIDVLTRAGPEPTSTTESISPFFKLNSQAESQPPVLAGAAGLTSSQQPMDINLLDVKTKSNPDPQTVRPGTSPLDNAKSSSDDAQVRK